MPTFSAGRFYEVLKYANETGHILLINFQVVSSQWFNKLPADQQTALVEECRAVGRATSEKIAKMNDEIKADLTKEGHGDRDRYRSRGFPQGWPEGL